MGNGHGRRSPRGAMSDELMRARRAAMRLAASQSFEGLFSWVDDIRARAMRANSPRATVRLVRLADALEVMGGTL